MSASQPAAPEPHEPAQPLVAPGDEPLRAMADADDVVWYIPEPDVPDAEVLPPSTDPEQRKIEMKPVAPRTPAAKAAPTERTAKAAPAKAPATKAATATASPPKAAANKTSAATKTATPRAAAAKPKAPAAAAKPKTPSAASKPKAPAKPRTAAAKPTAAKSAGARATAKPTGPSTAASKPRAPRRRAVAWPAPAPQAVPGAPAPAAPPAPAPVADETPTFTPAPVPDPSPSSAPPPAPDPNFVPQRPTVERREHIRQPERQAPAFRSPPPAQPTPQQAATPPAPVTPAAPAPPTAPVAAPHIAPAAPEPAPYVAPQAVEPYVPPQPPAAPAPVPYVPPQPAPRAYVPPQPAAPAPYVPPQQTPAPTPAAYVPSQPAPAAAPPQAAPYVPPPATHREAILAEAASKAPPGFTGAAILAAESRTLLALDPTEDETTRPAPVAEHELETIAGSAILGAVKSAVPRAGDRQNFGREKAATVRVALATIVAAALVVAIGPWIENQLIKLPFIGPMFGQLKAFTLYHSAYGIASIAATLSLVSVTGIVVAQMESTANKVGRRQDPNTRLNIGLSALIALIFTSGLFATMKSHGWAASTSSIGFFAATCLLVPLGNLPGARALRHLPSRAWAAAFVLSVVALVIYPSLPGALITVLSFTHVRTNWRAISDGHDEGADGPIEKTERKSAAMITAFALIAAAIGMHAMTLTPAQVRKAINTSPDIPGVVKGNQIAPPTSKAP